MKRQGSWIKDAKICMEGDKDEEDQEWLFIGLNNSGTKQNGNNWAVWTCAVKERSRIDWEMSGENRAAGQEQKWIEHASGWQMKMNKRGRNRNRWSAVSTKRRGSRSTLSSETIRSNKVSMHYINYRYQRQGSYSIWVSVWGCDHQGIIVHSLPVQRVVQN